MSSVRDRWTRAARAAPVGSRPTRTPRSRSSCRRRPFRRRRRRGGPGGRSAARQAADRRVLHPHPAVPLVELFEEVRIHLEKVQRRGIWKGRRFHETQKEKQIVQFSRLLTKVVLIPTERHAVHELPQAAAKHRKFFGPIHGSIITRDVYS